MTLRTTFTRLPDDIIIEISKSECLNNSDLFHCSLVSRKFVEGVNLLLHEQVRVVVYHGQSESEEDDDDNDVVRCEYSPKTWKLLRSLIDHSKLQQLVQSINFILYDCTLAGRSDEPAIETALLPAFSSFLRYCRNAKKVKFDDGWKVSIVELKIITQLINIGELSMDGTSVEDLKFISKQLPRIKHFHASTFLSSSTPTQLQSQSVTYPTNLESLALSLRSPEYHKAFVSANYSTLRYLSIPVEVAARRIEYSRLSQLLTLRLTNVCGPSEKLSSTVGTKFWRSLSRSPSLRCLVLLEVTYFNSYEEVLFGPHLRPDNTISTLRTVRFGEGIPFDRVNLLLSGPLGATLHHVVVSERFVVGDLDVYTKNRFNFLSGICQERGIEVVLEPW